MNSKALVIGAVALAAVVAGVVWSKRDVIDPPTATTPSASVNAGAELDNSNSQPHGSASPRTNAATQAPDPRLAALQVSADNGLIKFIVADNGKVIAEIDQDPASPGFGRPSREYVYMGDKVVALTAYRYMSDHVEITRTQLAYQPDGNVAEMKETTSYQNSPGNPR